MTGWGYFKKAFSQYDDFSSRARRSEFWYFTLFFTLFLFLLIFFFAFGMGAGFVGIGVLSGLFLGLLVLAFIIPSIAVTIRRLHDVGLSGWFYLISFIPYIGSFILLVICAQDSKPGSNQWGKNPKESNNDILDHLV